MLRDLLTAKSTKEKARAEAEGSVVDNYETYTKRVEDRLKELEEEVKQLRDQYIKLRNAIMTSYMCKYLRDNPNASCPVQENMQKGEKEC